MLCAYTRPRYQVSVYRTIGPLVYCCATADIFTKLLQQCVLFSLLWLYLGNSQVSVYRTIDPSLLFFYVHDYQSPVLCCLPRLLSHIRKTWL